MAKLTEFEKEITQAIVDLDREQGFCVLANMWERFFPDGYYLDVSDVSSPNLMIKSSVLNSMDNMSLQSLLNSLAQKCEAITSTFRFLQANRYLKLVGDYETESLGVVFAEEPYAAYPLNVEPEVFGPLAVVAHRRILPAQGLYDFVDNGFKTEDELKIEKQTRANKHAFNFALIGLFIAGVGLLITAIDSIKRWWEPEARVLIVNKVEGDKPSRGIPVVIDGSATGPQRNTNGVKTTDTRPLTISTSKPAPALTNQTGGEQQPASSPAATSSTTPVPR